MGKQLKAFRFPGDVYSRFKQVASKGGYTATAAFTRFMTLCVDWDELVFPEEPNAEGAEARARVLLNWWKKGKFWYTFETGKNLAVESRLLELLSKVEDKSLRDEIEAELKKH
ncbi:hypothetical protein KAU55_02765 [Candidatus Bathyarchaeota archaeon]|nr:hypothetical protein [Candidatus Bathyarchaeota archaeon]